LTPQSKHEQTTTDAKGAEKQKRLANAHQFRDDYDEGYFHLFRCELQAAAVSYKYCAASSRNEKILMLGLNEDVCWECYAQND
jgi:hypothetical protein